MKTLNAPLFELNQQSIYYKVLKEVKDNNPRIDQIIRKTAELIGYDSSEFVYYGSRGFGFYGDSKAYEKFKDQLTKRPDRNGVYTFKRTTSTYKTVSPRMLEIEKIQSKINPFALHDIFGLNNLVATQWIEDRFFVEVRSEEDTKKLLVSERRRKQCEIEPVKEIGYKEYLELVMTKVDDTNKS